MNVAVMQPYIYPYLGYFQLIAACDTFVFYDDVFFIKRGWINRNRILLNGTPFRFSVPCESGSYQKPICDVKVGYHAFDSDKLLSTFRHAYHSAPYFHDIFPLIEKNFTTHFDSIAEMAISGILDVLEYLKIDKAIKMASKENYNNQGLSRAQRLADITDKENGTCYINAEGGKSLYHQEQFSSFGVKLAFLGPELRPYRQQSSSFVPGLSMIDLLMNCSRSDVKKQLNNYTLSD